MPSRIVPGGTMLLVGSDGLTQSSSVTGSLDVLREIDLAGDTVRETNVDAINAQLQTRGQEHIYELHHEALRLPDGNTAVLGQTMQTINGTDVVGDMVIMLGSNFQVVWTWDAFDYAQQISNGNPYHPVLGELCSTGNPAALCAVPDSSALDWLHTNAISYSSADGNLIVSLRHQDWIVKIDYQNGQGDGHVMWRLGKNGDFTISSTDPNPWFSHQHDPHYVGLSTIVLFDNGNTRCTATNGSIITGCDSRGQALKLDEHNRTATLTLNTDLGGFSCALGSAQQLSPNNYAFGAGFFSNPPCIPGPASCGRSIETLADGSQTYAQQVNALEYRSFHVAGLYLGTDLGSGSDQRSLCRSGILLVAIDLQPVRLTLRTSLNEVTPSGADCNTEEA